MSFETSVGVRYSRDRTAVLGRRWADLDGADFGAKCPGVVPAPALETSCAQQARPSDTGDSRLHPGSHRCPRWVRTPSSSAAAISECSRCRRLPRQPRLGPQASGHWRAARPRLLERAGRRRHAIASVVARLRDRAAGALITAFSRWMRNPRLRSAIPYLGDTYPAPLNFLRSGELKVPLVGEIPHRFWCPHCPELDDELN
jgi:hypothetical protein